MPSTPAIKSNYDNVQLFVGNKSSYLSDKAIYVTNQHESKSASFVSNYDELVFQSNIPFEIKKAITDCKSLLNLKFNWDDNGALPVNSIALNSAISFLEIYSEKVLDIYGIEILSPNISPVKDSSVDLEWNLEKSYLLINFSKERQDVAIYYLALKEGDNILFDANGQINTKKYNDRFASDLAGLS